MNASTSMPMRRPCAMRRAGRCGCGMPISNGPNPRTPSAASPSAIRLRCARCRATSVVPPTPTRARTQIRPAAKVASPEVCQHGRNVVPSIHMVKADSTRKPVTVPDIVARKRDGVPLVMITAYDATFARLVDACDVDIVLVGDSLGMVVQGHEHTLEVTVDDMVYHARCVRRG